LAVGDIRLANYENSLANCWTLCLQRNRRGYHCTAALSNLVKDLAASTNADFVFFDAGPNIGPLNRVVLLDCSHFIVPAACDLFCDCLAP
jgi:cellulose biosynthesis protein BcsQ